MYTEFFGFRELPFNNTPDPRFFYSTPDHEEALASLIYGVRERKGFVLLTGEVGAGKTLVTRLMLRHFGTHVAFAMINHAVQTPDDLMESICTEFELPFRPESSSTQLVRKLHDFLLAQFAQDIRVVLVLDEAQNLPAESFEQLRMIGNLEADDAKLLQTAIVGQPELQRMFLSPALRQLRQRIFRAFHLPALSREATEGYIRHRLSVVTDGDVDIFNRSAIEAIYNVSHGLPRIINTVCDNSLLSAYSANRRIIDGPFVDTVIAQMLVVGDPQRRGEHETDASAGQPSRIRAAPAPVRRRALPKDEPDGDVDAERTPARPDPLAQSIEIMAQRVANIEAQYRDRPRIERIDTPTASSGGCDDPVDSIRQEPTPPDQDLRLILVQMTRRLSALERRFSKGGLGDLTEARAIRISLEHLVQQARSLVSRAEGASQQLQQRDGQLRKLAATIKNVTRDLRHLLVQASETTTKSSRAERKAGAVHDRLVAQSERSRKLADELTQIVNRMILHDTTDAPSTVLLKEGSAPIGSVPNPPQGIAFRRTDGKHVRQALASTRESLSELRSLARDKEDNAVESADASTELPAARLANQVENLLEMIEPHGTTDLEGPDTTPVATTA